MQVIVDGLLTNYVREGEGRVIVILHGWGDNSTSWLGLVKDLSKNFDVIVPDLPGFGGSQLPPSTWGLNDYSSFVSAFLEKIKISSVYCLIGHSNGGAIAIRGIAKNIIAADKLVLLSSAGIRGEHKGRLKGLSAATKTGKILTAPLPPSAKNRLRAQVYKAIGSDMLVAKGLEDTFKKIVSDDVQADAKTINTPTLIIYGENDEQTPLRYGETFHELIDYSSLEVITGAGHFIQLDKENEVKSAIEGFIE
jgi:pimeloyl-ACP methyl ester carboxylesterase